MCAASGIERAAVPTWPSARAISRQISVGSASNSSITACVPSSVRSSASASAQPWRRNALLLTSPSISGAAAAAPSLTDLPRIADRFGAAHLLDGRDHGRRGVADAAVAQLERRRSTRCALVVEQRDQLIDRRGSPTPATSASPLDRARTTSGTSSLWIAPCSDLADWQLDAERARLFGDRLQVVVGGIRRRCRTRSGARAALERHRRAWRSRSRRDRASPSDTATCASSGPIQRPHATALSSTWRRSSRQRCEREPARAHEVVLARRPREPARDRDRAPHCCAVVELRELVVAELAGLRVIAAEQVVAGAESRCRARCWNDGLAVGGDAAQMIFGRAQDVLHVVGERRAELDLAHRHAATDR